MARNDYETDPERGSPINLVKFDYGVGLSYFYTDHEVDFDYGGDTYTAIPMDIGALRADGRLGEGQVDITVPKTSLVAELFRIYPPTQEVGATIRQGHVPNADDPASYALGENFPVAWMGKVLDTERNRDGTVKLICQSAAAALRNPGLRRRYQIPCGHAVYGEYCRASKVAATAAAIVDTVGVGAANQITLVDGWLPVDRVYGDYVRGMVEWTSSFGTESRSILKMDDANTLYTTGPIRELVSAQDINIILRCHRDEADCRNLHANIVNYGGWLYAPKFNPIGVNNHTA